MKIILTSRDRDQSAMDTVSLYFEFNRNQKKTHATSPEFRQQCQQTYQLSFMLLSLVSEQRIVFVCTATLPFFASNNLPNPLGIATQTHRFHYISFPCTGLSVSDEHTQQEDAGWRTKVLYQSSHCRQLR